MGSTKTINSRRLSSRVETAGKVWVYWTCNGREDIARVGDISIGGIFLETPLPREVGITTKLHFLVQEGQIRAEAVVRHAEEGRGLGLKFTALSDDDRPHLAALMSRLRSFSRDRGEHSGPH